MRGNDEDADGGRKEPVASPREPLSVSPSRRASGCGRKRTGPSPGREVVVVHQHHVGLAVERDDGGLALVKEGIGMQEVHGDLLRSGPHLPLLGHLTEDASRLSPEHYSPSTDISV